MYISVDAASPAMSPGQQKSATREATPSLLKGYLPHTVRKIIDYAT